MPIRDYFKFFSTKDADINADYIIIFNNGRPNINNYENLRLLGNWAEYTEKGYRIRCKLSKEKFENLVSDELNIRSNSFKVIDTAEFTGIKL